MRRLLLIAMLVLSPLVHAGRPCEHKPMRTETFMKALQAAERTYAALEQSGAQVALVARVGQDLSKYGLRWSHLGVVWRDHPKGRWMVVHELNACGTASSSLFDQGLGQFFLDDMFSFDAAILIPSTADQQKLAALLASRDVARMHDARYNMLSYAFGSKYQNSNQWVLETYAAALSEIAVREREQAQAWLKLAGYEPVTLHLLSVTRLGARMFKANIAFDDHPLGRRIAGQIDTVTVESVVRFVRKRDAGARWMVVEGQ